MEKANSYRILVLDDDRIQGDLLQSYLEITGHFMVDPVVAQDQFWERITQYDYDVIFLDYKMPGANGLEILDRLNDRFIHVPVIMMTGEGDERVAAQAIQRGAVDYLIKGKDILPGLPGLIQNAVRVNALQRSVEESVEQIRFQALLLNNVRDAVVVWNSEKKIVFWNPAATELFGWTENERIGQSIDSTYLNSFSPPIVIPGPDGPDDPEIEREFTTKDDRKIWVSSQVTRLYNGKSEKETIGYMDVVRDITKRKLEQQALKESQIFIKKIIETTPNVLYIYDLIDLKLIFSNIDLLSVLGYTPDEINFSFTEIIMEMLHPDDVDLVLKYIGELIRIRDGEVLEVEIRIKHKSGQYHWLLLRNTTFLRTDDRRLHQVIGMVQDITERMETQVALQESETRYRAIVEKYQTEMIFRFLPDGTLTFVNETFCNVFGSTRQELLGKNFLDLPVEEDKEAVKLLCETVTQENPVVTSSYRVHLKNGNGRWHESTVRAIFDISQKIAEFQAIGHDITDRKSMEAQVMNAQTHLTQAARLASIGELAAGVAHQINNPLTTIIAEAQILQHRLGEDHSGQDSIHAIEEAGWRAQRVVEELLKFSQPTSDTYRSVELNSTIRQALTLVGANFQTKNIQLDVSLGDGLPPVYANPRQLEDLWINLLLVARSFYTRPGLVCESTSPTISITSSVRDAKWTCVKIVNNGDFIPQDQLEMIFEPALVPTSDPSVTGMELSICREIVRQNRGEISVSNSQKGLAFSIILPLEAQTWVPQIS